MKKFLKLFFIFIFAVLLWNCSSSVKANSINKISMDIFINKSGNAEITETWICSASEGTEIYHPYYNLGNSKISNLVVSENGNTYTTLSSWNTSGTLSSKAYKCGINTVNNGVELCWGISKYGSHTYTVKYTISNFVSELTDAQMVYWTLIPYNFSNTINSVYIKIYSNFNYSDTLEVWGYGDYGAPTYVYNGVIEMQSNGTLKSDEYMTILIKFPLGTFNTSNYSNRNFEYYYNMAEEGAEKYNSSSILGIILAIFYIFLILLSYFIILFPTKNRQKKDFKISKKSMLRVKRANYYRDIPCENNLFKAYYIAYQYGIIKKETDLLGAILLKWIKDSLVRLEKREGTGITKKEEEVFIFDEIDNEQIPDFSERKIYNMLREASKDGILEKNELKVWCQKNYKIFLSWFESILKGQKSSLDLNGYIVSKKKNRLFTNKTYLEETPELVKEAEKIAGFKQFLLDYTLISKREAIEVHLLEEYLIYAQMLGIAKKVSKQFKNLYPDIIEQSHFNNYDNIIFIHNYTSRGVHSARSAKSAADARARASSYSSGGGGFSSGGGGGGSFGGGGHGGGGFR
jgi:uncharacterized membrane protein YgcG